MKSHRATKVAIIVILGFLCQHTYSAVVVRGGGEESSCSVNEHKVPVYGGWASCYASNYGWIDDYIPATYSRTAWLKENSWEDGVLITHHCMDVLDQIAVDTLTTDECMYTPKVSLSTSLVYFENGDAFVTLHAKAESGNGTIETIAWDLEISSSFLGRTTSGGVTNERHKIKLPSSIPATVFAQVTVIDDKGNTTVIGGDLDLNRRGGGR